ncbi:MAG: hypothetical protein RQ885_04000 [Desulfurococcales archaeon]|nr:hypothetical protein [Desulfurococcales archaeon]
MAVRAKDLPSSVRQRAEDFHTFLSRYGILSTLSFYLEKASEDKAYEKLINALTGSRANVDREIDLGYAVLVKALFDYLSNLAKRSEVIPEICSLANKISPCIPMTCGEFIPFLRKLLDLDPYDKTLLMIILREFAEAIKSISRIHSSSETG